METFISFILSAFIMVITSIIFASIVLDKNLLDKSKFRITSKKIVAILISILLYSILALTIDGTVKTLCLCIIYVIIFQYLYKIEVYHSIFLTFMYTILQIVPDLLYLLFLIGIIGIEPEICYTVYAETTLTTLLINILFIIITIIFKKWLRKINNIKLSNNKEILLYVIITLACIIIIGYNGFCNIEVLSSNLLISASIMVAFVVILFNLIRQKIENKNIIEKYDKLLEFIKQYEVAIEEQKMLRHESKNQLITIKTKMKTETHKKIEEYINNLLNEHRVYKEEKYSMFQYLPANGLKGLFYYKAMEAEDNGIKLSIRVASKVEKSILKDLDTEEFKQLGRLVGIYLDNAIQASALSEEKKLGIEIYMHEEDVIIIIENTYAGEIDTESIGKVRYTTKGKEHGYGLMMVKKILNEYKRFLSERIITDKLYIQKLKIKKSIK